MANACSSLLRESSPSSVKAVTRKHHGSLLRPMIARVSAPCSSVGCSAATRSLFAVASNSRGETSIARFASIFS